MFSLNFSFRGRSLGGGAPIPFNGGLILNGGFEDTLTDWDPLGFGEGSTGIVTREALFLTGPVVAFEFTNTGARGIQQTVTIEPGVPYDYSYTVYNSVSTGDLRVQINGDVSGAILSEDTLTDGVVVNQSGTITTGASDTTVTLFLRTRADGAFNTEIDNVRLQLTAPVAAGALPNLDGTVGTPITPVDIATDFTGGGMSYERFSGTLPAGLIETGTVISGTPTEAVVAPIVYRGSNISGEAFTTLNVNIVGAVPGQVLNLTATGGAGQIILNWDPVVSDPSVTDYIIEFDTGGGFSVLADGPGIGTSYTHTGIGPSELVGYRVSAVNSEGTGPASDEASATTDAVPGSGPVITGSLPDVLLTAGVAMTPVDVLSIATNPTGAEIVAPAALPAGLAFDTLSGALSGTPTNPGTVFMSFRATGAGGTSVLYGFTLEVRPAIQALLNEDPTIAFNVDENHEWNPGDPWLNRIKMGTPWSAQRSSSPELVYADLVTLGVINATGYPNAIPADVTEFNTFLAWGDFQAAAHYAGDYVLKWDAATGDGGTARAVGVTGDTLESVRRRTFTYGGTGNVSIFFDMSSGFPENIRLVRAEDEALLDQGGIFTPLWVAQHQNSRELRFLDWFDINNSDLINWADRTTPEHFTWNGTDLLHVPIEIICAACNITLSDAGLNIPHQFTDAAVTSMAQAVFDNLDPTLTAKFEYSNEVWNFGFQQNLYCQNQSLADWGVNSAVGWQVKRATECAQLIDVVYAGNEGRRKHRLGVNQGIPSQTTAQLDATDWFTNEPAADIPANDPRTTFDEVAITTYFGASSEVINQALVDAVNDVNVNENEFLYSLLLDAGVESSVPNVLSLIDQHVTAASPMEVAFYEGGSHVHFQTAFSGDLDTFLTAWNRSDYCADLYQRIWDGIASRSVGPAMHFTDIGPASSFGSWGLREFPEDTGSRRINYVEAKNRQDARWWTELTPTGKYTGGVNATRDLLWSGYIHSLFTDAANGGNVEVYLHRAALAEPAMTDAGSGEFITGLTDFSTPPGNSNHDEDGVTPLPYDGSTWASFESSGMNHFMYSPYNFQFDQTAINNSVDAFRDTFDAIDSNTTLTPQYWLYAGVEDYDLYLAGTGESLGNSPLAFANWKASSNPAGRTFYTTILSDLQVARPAANYRMMDMDRIAKNVLTHTSLSSATAADLFKDGAPHGAPVMYVIYAMAAWSYMTNRPLPEMDVSDFTLFAAGSSMTNSDFTDNWVEIRDYVYNEVRTDADAVAATPIPDTTAPVLSAPVAAANGTSAMTGSVTTDEAATVYLVTRLSTATAPSDTQIIAGTDGDGLGVPNSSVAGAAGVIATSATGLSASTDYITDYVARDAALNTSNVVRSASFTTDAAADVTPPTLSAPTDAANGWDASTASVSTNEGGGTLYVVVSTSATPPSVAQIQAGQDSTGSAAAFSASQAVSGTGVQTITPAPSGLSGSTTYTTHFQQEDAATNDSTVSSASGFTTSASPDVTAPALTSATDATNGSTESTGSVSTDEDNGTLYWVVTTSATPPSVAQIQAGQGNTGTAATASGSQAVSATGAQATAATGLTAATGYFTHFQHQDASTNDSTVASASGFTTDAAAEPGRVEYPGGTGLYSISGYAGSQTQFTFATRLTPRTGWDRFEQVSTGPFEIFIDEFGGTANRLSVAIDGNVQGADIITGGGSPLDIEVSILLVADGAGIAGAGGDTIRMYIDGTLVASDTATFTAQTIAANHGFFGGQYSGSPAAGLRRIWAAYDVVDDYAAFFNVDNTCISLTGTGDVGGVTPVFWQEGDAATWNSGTDQNGNTYTAGATFT